MSKLSTSEPEVQRLHPDGGSRPAAAAELLGISLSTVWRRIKSGELESVRFGRTRLVRNAAIIALMHGKAA